MNKFLLIIFGSLFFGCNANEVSTSSIKPEFESISFDVVEKSLNIDTDLPIHVQNLITYYFNEKVKIDGFEGDMFFTISEFNQDISSIDNGKRIDLSLTFNVYLNIKPQNQTKTINGKVSSFGTITGNFSLKDFDVVIMNAQTDLVKRLSRDLKSKT